MKQTLKLSVYLFMFGVGLSVFGGSTILFKAETQSIDTISLFFKISTIIGVGLIVLSMILFGIVTMLSGNDK